jgi:exportin-5
MDMDSMLVQLWEVPDSSVHKEVVLFILETLSDEVFTGDDAVVAFREGILSKACVEVFTPLSVLLESFPNRQAGPDVRQGTEGWLSRLSAFLEFCLTSDAKDNEEVKSCAVKGLSTFLSLMPWAIPKAIAAARCVDIMLTALNSTNIDAQKVGLSVIKAFANSVY